MADVLLPALRGCVAVPAAIIILIEILKTAVIARAFSKSADGNVIGTIAAAEGCSFFADAVVLFLSVLPYDQSRASSLFALCVTFLFARVASSVTLSRILRK